MSSLCEGNLVYMIRKFIHEVHTYTGSTDHTPWLFNLPPLMLGFTCCIGSLLHQLFTCYVSFPMLVTSQTQSCWLAYLVSISKGSPDPLTLDLQRLVCSRSPKAHLLESLSFDLSHLRTHDSMFAESAFGGQRPGRSSS